MRIRMLHREQWLKRPLHEVFEFFAEARNLDRITPPWLRFQILSVSDVALHAGTYINYRLTWHGLPLKWTTVITEWNPPSEFIDLQAKGPYRYWRHRHTFESRNGGTVVGDTVEYAVPFGFPGDLLAGRFVSRDVSRIFDYRIDQLNRIFNTTEASD